LQIAAIIVLRSAFSIQNQDMKGKAPQEEAIDFSAHRKVKEKRKHVS